MILIPILSALALAFLVAWWFVGPMPPAGPEFDVSAIAAGFPEAKYRAMIRLMDRDEARQLRQRRDMPLELAEAILKGRREALLAYLGELGSDFRRMQRLYARAQASHPSPSPGAARSLLSSWARFTWLSLGAQWATRRGGAPSADRVAAMVDETRSLFDLAAGRT